MPQRYLHIDIAKGLVILLVVLTHNSYVFENKEVVSIIKSFTIPLFCFLSGLFFNPSRSFISTVGNRSDTLLKPYLVTLIFLGIAYLFYKDINLSEYIFDVIWSNGRGINWVTMWFLTHLFALTMFAWLINYIFDKLRVNNIIRYIILVGLLIIGINTKDFFWMKEITFQGETYLLRGLPFSADFILITVFFFLMGHRMKDSVISFKPSNFLLMLALLTFVLLHIFFNKTIDVFERSYDGVIIPTIEAISGIYLILSISYLVQSWSKLTRLLAYIGEASLFLLIFHIFFQYRAFRLAEAVFGNGPITASFAFLVGIFMPVLLYTLVKKVDFLALFYLPLKSNKLIKQHTNAFN